MLPQVTLTFLLTLTLIKALPPPGYKKKPENPDEHPPKYAYQYEIESEKGTGQGKTESRDGEFASGRYYVQGKNSTQSVQYLADDWGYHSLVEYSNVGPHSSVVTQFALDSKAVKALRKGSQLTIPETVTDQIKIPNHDKSSNRQVSQEQPHQNYAIQSSTPQAIQEEQINIQQNLQHEVQKLARIQQQADREHHLESIAIQKLQQLQQLQQIQEQEQQILHQQHLDDQQRHLDKQQHLQRKQQLEEQQKLQKQQQLQEQQLILKQQQLIEQQQLQKQQLLLQEQQQIQNKLQGKEQPEEQQHLEDQQVQEQKHQIHQQQHQEQNVFYLQHIGGQNPNQQLPILIINQNQDDQRILIPIPSHQLPPGISEQQDQVSHKILIPIQQPYQSEEHQNQVTPIQPQALPLKANSQTEEHNQNQVEQKILIPIQQPQALPLKSTEQEEQHNQRILISMQPQALHLKPSKQSEQQDLRNQDKITTLPPNVFQADDFAEQARILLEGGAVVLQGIQNPILEYQDQQSPLIVLQDQVINGAKTAENQNSQYETAALYESPGNRLINSNSADDSQEDSLVNLENAGGYGSKLNVKVTHRSKPIRIYKHLVSGQDVLNINQAINENLERQRIETSTLSGATAIVSEYGPVSITPNIIKQEDDISSNAVSSSTVNTIIENTENTLAKKPIIVADEESYSENTIHSTTEFVAKNQEEEQQNVFTESTVDITPRPISSKFLAPITAGVQLQTTFTESPEKPTAKENFVVDIQKSIPYYLGKIEYYNQQEEQRNKEANYTVTATQNLQLGGFLQHPVTEAPKVEKFSQSLSSPGDQKDQVQEQGEVQVTVVDKPEIKPTRVFEKSVEITKYVDKPYPVGVPVHVPIRIPVPVEKPVPVPIQVEVEKIIEKPVTKIVEKPIHIPHPVRVPVEITKYVDRPYPVPVEHPVLYPVQVEKIVEKIVKQPYPVEVPVQVRVPHPVPVTVEKQVPVPQYIEKPVPVEKIVEKPVPHYIPKPYPVAIPVAQAYYIPVEVSKPYPVDFANKPYAVPQSYPIHLIQPTGVPINQDQGLPVGLTAPPAKQVNRPYLVYFNNNKQKHPPSKNLRNNNHNQKFKNSNNNNNNNHETLSYAASIQTSVKTPCVDLRQFGIQKPVCAINNNNYIGLVPPKLPYHFSSNNNSTNNSNKNRKARHNFDNVELEYGFMPPLIPSLPIDENGNPVEKHTK